MINKSWKGKPIVVKIIQYVMQHLDKFEKQFYLREKEVYENKRNVVCFGATFFQVQARNYLQMIIF